MAIPSFGVIWKRKTVKSQNFPASAQFVHHFIIEPESTPTQYQRVLFNIWCLAQRAVRLCFHLGTLLHSWLCFHPGGLQKQQFQPSGPHQCTLQCTVHTVQINLKVCNWPSMWTALPSQYMNHGEGPRLSIRSWDEDLVYQHEAFLSEMKQNAEESWCQNIMIKQ